MTHGPLARDDVLAALERTARRGSARTTFHVENAAVSYDPPAPPSALGTPARLWHLAVDLVLRKSARLLRDLGETLSDGSSGLIDFEGRRCVQQYPGARRAELVIGDRLWRGAPGTAVTERTRRPMSSFQPLWLVDLAGGLVDAREDAAEEAGGRLCRRFSAHADLRRAAEALPYEMPGPDHATGDLGRIPITVWIDDDGFVRRLRHDAVDAQGQPVTTTLNLSDLGAALPADWSRVPRVR